MAKIKRQDAADRIENNARFVESYIHHLLKINQPIHADDVAVILEPLHEELEQLATKIRH